MPQKLHLFNPGHETAVLHEAEIYTPTKNVARMMRELSTLPLWYALKEDYVWVAPDIAKEFEEQISTQITPNGKILTSASLVNSRKDIASKKMECVPWGLSPHVITLFDQIEQNNDLSLDIPEWRKEYKNLTSRRTALLALSLMKDKGIDIPFLPVFYSDIESLENGLRAAGYPVMIKTPFSSSGRGLIRIPKSEFHYKEKEWVMGAIRRQGEVSMEPALERMQDFALEYYSDGNTVCYEGLSCFNSVSTGSYSGNILDSQTNMMRYFIDNFGEAYFMNLIRKTAEVLKEIYVSAQYKGYLGVDMMVYKKKDLSLAIHPCVEINMRNTMGLVAIKLYNNYVSEGSRGNFVIEYYKEKGKALQEHKRRCAELPLTVRSNKIEHGHLSLIPITEETHYSAYMQID